jgi:hypothetical protein
MRKPAPVARDPRYWASLATLLLGIVLMTVSFGLLRHGSSAGGVTQILGIVLTAIGFAAAIVLMARAQRHT